MVVPCRTHCVRMYIVINHCQFMGRLGSPANVGVTYYGGSLYLIVTPQSHCQSYRPAHPPKHPSLPM